MKTIIVLSILFSAIVWLPVGAELTETDLENIRQIFREEFREELEKPIIDHIDASLGEIDARFDSINRTKNSVLGGTAKSGSCRFCQLSIAEAEAAAEIAKVEAPVKVAEAKAGVEIIKTMAKASTEQEMIKSAATVAALGILSGTE